MSKRKPPAQIVDEIDLWDIEAKRLVSELGLSPDNARRSVILQWMLQGDFRPLASSIHKREPLSDGVLDALATMIDEDRLTAKPIWEGRPVDPAKDTRDYAARLIYEDLIKDYPSDVAFQMVALALRTTEDSVRKAVTPYRK